MNIEERMKEKLEADLNPHMLELIDESSMHGSGSSKSSHFRVLIVSDVFEGLSGVKRHQRVYSTLGKDIMDEIHAFSQQTYTLKEWEEIGIKTSSPPCHRKK